MLSSLSSSILQCLCALVQFLVKRQGKERNDISYKGVTKAQSSKDTLSEPACIYQGYHHLVVL